MDTSFQAVCEFLGISENYYDLEGNNHIADDETIRNILRAFGYSDIEISQPGWSWRKLERARISSILDTVYFISVENQPGKIRFRWPKGIEFADTTLEIELEEGPTFEIHLRNSSCSLEKEFYGYWYREYELSTQEPLLPGYHKLQLKELPENFPDPDGLDSWLIVHPNQCYHWQSNHSQNGLAVQLYSLRSSVNDGIGDFRDLLELGEDARESGFTIVGINPIHSLFPDLPEHKSPYSPSSRLFKNPIYIHLPWILEELGLFDLVREYETERKTSGMISEKSAEQIDYSKVYSFKMKYLLMAFRSFQKDEGPLGREMNLEFREFLQSEGEALLNHSLYEAIAFHNKEFGPASSRWPNGFRNPNDRRSEKQKEDLRESIEFFGFLQWIAHRQFESVHAKLLRIGISLYLDLAVGPHPFGSETWCKPIDFSDSVSVGAPPDPFAPHGQNWGLAPLHPRNIKLSAYQAFRSLLEKNMPREGMLRIDHALGLFRLFWIPSKGGEGTYIQYPYEDLLKIVALESQRNKCIVIGEDLGTVPLHARDFLLQYHIYSWKVLYFEKEESGEFKDPASYPSISLATHNTHDLPTLAGFWSGNDIDIRLELGIITQEEWQTLREEREKDKEGLVSLLFSKGLLQNESESEWTEIRKGLMRLLESAGSQIHLYSLHDILEESRQPNLPGTVDEYPNWSLRLSQHWKEASFFRKARRKAFEPV